MGFAIGPALGGVMAQSLGLHLPFVACAAGLVAASGSAAYLLPETGHMHRHLAAGRRGTGPQGAQRVQGAQRAGHASEGQAGGEAGEEAGGEAGGARKVEQVSRASLLARPALQGLGALVFMNGFSQGAMPVTFVLYATEYLQMSSAAVGGMLTLNVLMMVLISAPVTPALRPRPNPNPNPNPDRNPDPNPNPNPKQATQRSDLALTLTLTPSR